MGGDPNKVVEVEQDGSLRLLPRKSRAMARNGSINVFTLEAMWNGWALELRIAIVGIVLRRAAELAKSTSS